MNLRRALLCLLSGIVLLTVLPASAQEQPFAATLTPAAGLVQIRAHGSADWLNVPEVQLIRPGAEIRTGSDGFARLETVTGIEIEIYPATQVRLAALALGENSGQIFNLVQLVGMTFTAFTPPSNAGQDQVQLTLPAAGLAVRGTKFFTLLSPTLEASIIVQENQVHVNTLVADTFEVNAEQLLYLRLDLPDPPPTECSADLLRTNITASYVIVPIAAENVGALRGFLRDTLTSNLNPRSRNYLGQLVGLKPVELSLLDGPGDEIALREVLAGIDQFDVQALDLINLLESYRAYWADDYRAWLGNPLPVATCGNNQRDPGESAVFCPNDFNNTAFCGNSLCETDRRGVAESMINCPKDCLPYASLAQSCAASTLSSADSALETPEAGTISTPSGVGN